jgi:hypothetical protein
MAYRWKPRYAEVDADNPQAWATCDRCGFVWNLYRLTWQYDYRGTSQLQNIRILVCPPCYDTPNPQMAPVILPVDPPPIFNARPEPYTVDEASWLVTQDGDILDTQDGERLITSIPNPGDDANTAHLFADFAYAGGSLAVAYLDLFDGNPLAAGTSVLATITGSAVRTNVTSALATADGVAVNPDVITVTSSAAGQTNLSYIAFYNAASGGALLTSGPLAVSSPPSIVAGAVVQFDALGLRVDLN